MKSWNLSGHPLGQINNWLQAFFIPPVDPLRNSQQILEMKTKSVSFSKEAVLFKAFASPQPYSCDQSFMCGNLEAWSRLTQPLKLFLSSISAAESDCLFSSVSLYCFIKALKPIIPAAQFASQLQSRGWAGTVSSTPCAETLLNRIKALPLWTSCFRSRSY